MAPSTALLFLLFGVTAALAASKRYSQNRFLIAGLAGVGTLASAALLPLSMLGLLPGIEHLGMHLPGEVAGVHIGHISPVTALGFVVAGLSLALSTVSGGHVARTAFGTAVSVQLMGATLTVAYILSRPAFYDGGMIPPALSTSFGLMLLGGALIGVAAGRLWGVRTDWDRAPTSLIKFALGVGLAVGAIVTPAILLFRDYEADFHGKVEAHQLAIADLKVDQIEDWRSERVRDGTFFQSNPVFADHLRRALYDGEPGAVQELDAWVATLMGTPEYSRVTLVARDGQVRRVIAEPELAPSEAAAISDAALRAMISGQVTLDDYYDRAGTGAFALILVAPIADAARIPLGALVITIDPTTFLNPLLQSAPTPTRTGETLLVRREGDEVVFLNDVRFHGGGALSLRHPLSRSNLPAARAARGEEGVVYGVDYRGERVVAALRAVPGSDWKLVSRVDIAEVYGPLRSRLAWTVALVALLLVGLVGALALGWQRREKVHYRELAGAERRYRTLLRSIGDAVIATDPDGVIELLNPVAEQLTGWTEAEALGRKLEDVFCIIQQVTREPVENPVSKVLRHGGIVGFANHTVLISRDGREYPIVNSGAPVRAADGSLAGVVLAFQDRTEEWTARTRLEEEIVRSRQSEAKYRDLFSSIRDAILVADTDRAIIDCNPAFTDLLGYELTEVAGRQTREMYENDEEYERMGSELRANMGHSSFFSTIRFRKKSGEIIAGEANTFYLKGADGQVTGFIGLIRDVTERLRVEEANRAQMEELRRWQAVMLDREERIAELKSRINSLHRRLGEPGPYEAIEPVTWTT